MSQEPNLHADGIPLHRQLQELRAGVEVSHPDVAASAQALVERLEGAAAGSTVPQAGEPMPNFMLPDEAGHLVSLEDLLAKAPVLVTFHRGHWCPYCTLGVAALAQCAPALGGVQVVAISGEIARYSKQMKAESQAQFPFLTDFGLGYSLSLNLAIWVDELAAQHIRDFGHDVAVYQGSDSWILPIPAVFAVSQDGIIRASHVDPDYRRRADPELLMAMAATLTTPESVFEPDGTIWRLG